MLPSNNRLKKDKDFDNLFKKGATFSYGFLYLKIIKNYLDYTRFGFIVSKKVSNKAVIRNKIKRKLRALIRERLSKIKKGFDIVIVVKPTFEIKRLKEMETVIEELLKKADIYNKIS